MYTHEPEDGISAWPYFLLIKTLSILQRCGVFPSYHFTNIHFTSFI